MRHANYPQSVVRTELLSGALDGLLTLPQYKKYSPSRHQLGFGKTEYLSKDADRSREIRTGEGEFIATELVSW